MSITGIRPANVTGPDKVRGSTDHVRCITLPAQGEPVRFPFKSLMRLPIHVEDISEAFARVLLSDSPHHSLYNSGGSAISLGDLAEIVPQVHSRRQDRIRWTMGDWKSRGTTWSTTAGC